MAKEILIDLDLSGNKINNTIVGENIFLYTTDGALSYGTNGFQINDNGVKDIIHSGNISQYASTATASNGLNKVGNDIQLGGTLSNSITFDGVSGTYYSMQYDNIGFVQWNTRSGFQIREFNSNQIFASAVYDGTLSTPNRTLRTYNEAYTSAGASAAVGVNPDRAVINRSGSETTAIKTALNVNNFVQSSGFGSTGMGVKIEMGVETGVNTGYTQGAGISYSMTNATWPTGNGKLSFQVNHGSTTVGTDVFELSGTGVKINITPNTGTAGYSYLVREDATGIVKQVTTAGAPTVTASNGLTKTGNDIQLGGPLTGAVNISDNQSNSFSIGGYYDMNDAVAELVIGTGYLFAQASGGMDFYSTTSAVTNGAVSFGAALDTDDEQNTNVSVAPDGVSIVRHAADADNDIVSKTLKITNDTRSVINAVAGFGVKLGFDLTWGSNVNTNLTGGGISYILDDPTPGSIRGHYDFEIINASVASKILELNRYGLVYNADYSANYTNRSLVDKAYVDLVASGSGSGWSTTGATVLENNVTVDASTSGKSLDFGSVTPFQQVSFATKNLTNKTGIATILAADDESGGYVDIILSATDGDQNAFVEIFEDGVNISSTDQVDNGFIYVGNTAINITAPQVIEMYSFDVNNNTDVKVEPGRFKAALSPAAGTTYATIEATQDSDVQSTISLGVTAAGFNTGFSMVADFSSGLHIVTLGSNAPTFEGLKYGANYSANFTDRSLVDKQYVVNAIYQAGTAGSAPFTGSFTQIPFVNTTSTGYSYSNDLVYKTATQQFVGGNASTAPSGSLTFTYGDSNVNKGTFGSVMFGELSEIDVNVGSGFNAGENNYISAYGGHTMGRGVRATGAYSWAGGWYSPNSVFAKTNAKAVTVSGEASFGFFETNGAQTDGHGVQSNASAVLGGSNPNIPADSHRTVILGGNGIKARANDSDQVYVANFNIVSTPISGTAGYSFLVRDNTTGQVKQVASAGGGSSSVTASNGLTKIGDDIQLGGALTGATTVDVIGSNNFTYNWDNGFSSTGSVEIGGSTSVFEAQADDPSFGFSSADVRSSQVSIYHESAAETETYTLTLSDSGLDLNATYNFEDYTRLYLEASSTPGVPTLRVETFDNANAVQNAEALTIDKNGISIAVKDVTDTQVAKLEITNAVTTYHDNRVTKTGIQYAADYSTTYTNRSLVDKEYVDKAVTVDAVKYTAVANNQTASDPGTGNIRWNNATLTSSTALYIDDETAAGIDISNYLALFSTNATIFIQNQDNSAVYQRWKVTSVTDNTGWWTYGVSLLDSAGVIAQSDKLIVAFRAVAPSPVVSYKTTITGDNSTTDFVITHALSSLDTVIQVYRNTSPYDQVVVAIERTSTNTSTIKFGVAPTGSDSYRVFVIAI